MAKNCVVFLKLSDRLNAKLRGLAEGVNRNRCEVLRALVASASVEDLPRAWQNRDEAEILAESEG